MLLARRSSRLMPQLSLYTLASGVALGIDFATYIALLSAGLMASVAAIIGYAAGMIVQYGLSLRFVFDARRSDKSDRRRFIEFIVSGMIGMTLTALIVAVASDVGGFNPVASKVAAALVSFGCVFALRRWFVFAR